MNNFTEMASRSARLKILEVLEQAPGYSANNEVLRMALDATGLRLSMQQIRAELSFLADSGAVTITDLGVLTVAELTERGHDLAKGRSSLRGIDRPMPGSGL